jgi:hypothetical protein
MAMSIPHLDSGEKLLAELQSDKGRYWRDHAILAVLGMIGAGVVLTVMGSEHVAIGSLGAVGALAVRGLYLAREQLGFRWYLTDKRILLPGGQQVMLLEIETVRKLMGDMQIITRAGDKHLVKHLADADAVVTQITDARTRRSRKTRD